MAEAIGVIASVATIAALAKPTAKFVRTLRRIARDENSIAHEIGKVASHFELSSTAIDLAVQQLKGHCFTLDKMTDAPSMVVKYMHKHKLTDAIRHGLKTIENQLIDAAEHLDSMRRGSMRRGPKFIKHVRWYLWKKMEVESLFPEMDRVNIYLSLICPVLHLEITQYFQERSEAEVARCMEAQIESLRNQLKTTETLHLNILDSSALGSNHREGLDAEFHVFARRLIHLSRSMRHGGAAPLEREPRRMNRSSTSEDPYLHIPSELSTHVHRDEDFQAYDEPRRSAPRRTYRSKSPRSTSSAQTPQSSYSYVSDTSTSSYTHKHRHMAAPKKLRSESSRRTSSISSRESHSSLSSISPQTPRTPETPQTPQSSRKPEIPGLPKSLLFSSTDTQRNGTPLATSGHLTNIETREKGIHVTAKLDPTTFSDNYISIRLAEELGLDIMELESQHSQHTHTVGGTAHRRIIGKVSGVRWQQAKWSKPIVLDFWVKEFYPHAAVELVFGKDFMQAFEKQN